MFECRLANKRGKGSIECRLSLGWTVAGFWELVESRYAGEDAYRVWNFIVHQSINPLSPSSGCVFCSHGIKIERFSCPSWYNYEKKGWWFWKQEVRKWRVRISTTRMTQIHSSCPGNWIKLWVWVWVFSVDLMYRFGDRSFVGCFIGFIYLCKFRRRRCWKLTDWLAALCCIRYFWARRAN